MLPVDIALGIVLAVFILGALAGIGSVIDKLIDRIKVSDDSATYGPVSLPQPPLTLHKKVAFRIGRMIRSISRLVFA
jgi:hypothetical protein